MRFLPIYYTASVHGMELHLGCKLIQFRKSDKNLKFNYDF